MISVVYAHTGYAFYLLFSLFSTFKKILHSIYHLISDITYGFEVWDFSIRAGIFWHSIVYALVDIHVTQMHYSLEFGEEFFFLRIRLIHHFLIGQPWVKVLLKRLCELRRCDVARLLFLNNHPVPTLDRFRFPHRKGSNKAHRYAAKFVQSLHFIVLVFPRLRL